MPATKTKRKAAPRARAKAPAIDGGSDRTGQRLLIALARQAQRNAPQLRTWADLAEMFRTDPIGPSWLADDEQAVGALRQHIEDAGFRLEDAIPQDEAVTRMVLAEVCQIYGGDPDHDSWHTAAGVAEKLLRQRDRIVYLSSHLHEATQLCQRVLQYFGEPGRCGMLDRLHNIAELHPAPKLS